MGRLRLLHGWPETESVQEVAKAAKKETAEVGRIGLPERMLEYAIQPRRVKDADLPFIPPNEIKKNNGEDGRRLFIVVDSLVIDCTTYMRKHPGGASIIQGFGGQDCSWQWWTFHNRRVWNDVLLGLRVGKTDGMENAYERPSRTYVGLRRFGWEEGYS